VRIDIHRPELEAIINERLQSGTYDNAEDVIWQALRSFEQFIPPTGASEAKNLVELFEPVRGLLADDEVDTLFSRNPSTGRPVDLG
jgi:Arc/MetJ-type ribon-helix-helix transcriptional regulator